MSSSEETVRQLRPAPESVSVESADATTIVYDLYEARSRTAVVVVPGFWRERRHPFLLALAAQLTGAGYCTAIADPRGHGDSGGTYGFNLLEHEDLAAVTRDVLRRCSGVEAVTFLAFSYGAANAISAAARHALPVTSLLLISPVADFSMIQPRINPFTLHRHITLGQALRRPRFDWHLLRSPKLSAVDDVGNVHAPLCLIHVKNDWLINHTHSIALYEAANEPKELHVIDIPGNYHADRIFAVAREEIEPICREFLEKYSPV
ncbi:MAG TPA: alpha/beta fold hydrolase [Thermoanaerobaculia bacterium]|nr:alpha/beta fold hydrolase [Thermoanaerobaculia bacterium]